ncbi:ESAT-6 secretion machinery protein EssC [Pseudoclavibacter triregionum]|nr:ESAT-6 secretion machinery protein EssC [Pseudoclavibacter triregionum]
MGPLAAVAAPRSARGAAPEAASARLVPPALDAEEEPIRLPGPVEAIAPRPLPVLLIVAPVLASLVLAASTGMRLALAFAVLGPVVGIASWLEGRRAARARRRASERRRRGELARAEAELEARAERLLMTRRRLAPLLVDLAERPSMRHRASEAPTTPPGAALRWTLGAAALPTGIAVEGGRDPSDEAAASLARRARRLDGSPVVLVAERIALRGPASLREPVLRAMAVHAAAHGAATSLDGRVRELDPDDPEAPAALPELRLDPDDRDRAVLILGELELELAPERASAAEARELLALLSATPRAATAEDPLAPGLLPLPAATQTGPGAPHLDDPGSGAVADGDIAAAVGLPATFARCAEGPVEIDLVRDGPHAIVGGTTGSGKSELLLAWAACLAATFPPDRLALLGIDFKGGATFDALAALPHCAGVVTDLDEEGAVERAVASLRAELRRREGVLRTARVRSLEELEGRDGAPPRLVILVDELQALLEPNPELHAAFADLAARGRSLGIHLVLCAQRPSAAMRDALMANCSIRICLRVTSAAESQAVIGGPQASAILPEHRGRAWIELGDGPTELQALRLEPGALAALAERWRASAPTRGVVAPPLPETLRREDDPALAAPGAIGLVDDPEGQRRAAAVVEPGERLLVVGGPGSGKSGALAAISASRPEARRIVLGRAPGTAWLRLAEAERAAAAGERAIVLADDLDALGLALDDARRAELAERLAALTRAGGRVELHASLQRLGPPWSALSAHASATLLLGTSSRQEHLLAGGERGSWRRATPPGRGELRGRQVQLLLAEPLAWMPEPATPVAELEGPVAVVSRRHGIRARLEASGWSVAELPDAAPAPSTATPTGPRVAVLGELEAWSRMPLAVAAARRGRMLLDGLSPGEHRALLRGDPTPPPVDDPARQLVLREPDGTMRLATLEAAR